MAVTQTGAMYKSLTFDNQTSREYGVYITGEAVYNAPERAVEMISIPGRNGSFALDQGRFENIEVTYPAGIFAENESDFAQAVSDFRNFLCSKKGYCRLTDEYNPSEYRMAVYKSGLEVDPAQLRAGEFNITFECKPQRWLTSGETATAVASGGTLSNPTPFEAGPLLEIKGYGTIELAGYEIELVNETMGEITLVKGTSGKNSAVIPQGVLNVGDEITIKKATFVWRALKQNANYKWVRTDYSKSADTNAYASTRTDQPGSDALGSYTFTTTFTDVPLTFGTSKTETNSVTANVKIKYGGTDYSTTITAQQTITYNGQWYITFAYSITKSGGKATIAKVGNSYDDIMGDSSVSLLGNPTYIDCDLGEAYKYAGGIPISLNKYIDLGSDLPKLASGANTITFDNTITELKVAPRWWKV